MPKEEILGYNEFLQSIPLSDEPFTYKDRVIGYPFDLHSLVSTYGKEIIPDKLGIYHLFLDERLIYIGMSKNLKERLLYHLNSNDMPFNYCLWFVLEEMSLKRVLLIEKRLIKSHKPSLNTMHFSKK